jgi:hypothetical protein
MPWSSVQYQASRTVKRATAGSPSLMIRRTVNDCTALVSAELQRDFGTAMDCLDTASEICDIPSRS